uniref:Uncharacterized protein n=1 Tax=Romanomermis culicivorax TaxID=13658 RepID=A0A915JX38_ROMCU
MYCPGLGPQQPAFQGKNSLGKYEPTPSMDRMHPRACLEMFAEYARDDAEQKELKQKTDIPSFRESADSTGNGITRIQTWFK